MRAFSAFPFLARGLKLFLERLKSFICKYVFLLFHD